MNVATSQEGRAAVERCDALFVVGASRSGTTMMGRMLGAHPAVHAFHELHFFEELWDPTESGAPLDEGAARRLACELLRRGRAGTFPQTAETQAEARELEHAARQLVAELAPVERTPLRLYEHVLRSEAMRAGASVPLDHTPRNAYHLPTILAAFPRARVVAMVRDPRGVLRSQKHKWRRRSLGATNLPRREALRAWVNYHPVAVARLWRATARRLLEQREHPRLEILRYENVLADPRAVLEGLSERLGLAFDPAMLAVPRVGSSVAPDEPRRTGIAPSVERGAGLPRDPEICEAERRIGLAAAGPELEAFGYAPADGRASIRARLGFGLTLAPRMSLALLLNRRRVRRLGPALARRLR